MDLNHIIENLVFSDNENLEILSMIHTQFNNIKMKKQISVVKGPSAIYIVLTVRGLRLRELFS